MRRRAGAQDHRPMKLAVCLLLIVCLPSVSATGAAAAERLNLLLITVDDMSADSIGAFGCRLADTTPHLDRFAQQSLRFTRAHVQVGNCMPSRNVMWSGRYPHNNGVEGFYQVPDADYPVLVDLVQDAGYFAAIRHKVSHSTPYHPYHWDLVLDTLPDGTRAHVKDPVSYGTSTAQGIAAAQQAGKPFCLVINIADPHKPFYAEGRRGETIPDPHKPSRVFAPDEPPTPGFLFEDPVVSKELAHYYSSVRRADDAFGNILRALEESGQADRTLVMFLSDHGMPLPFAKTQLYHHSTHTPLMFCWPGVTQPGAVDDRHMVSAVDFLPTLLDVIGLPHPEGIDGHSFAPLLRGQPQEGRDYVIKEYNENAGGSRDPMRAVQTQQLLYLFNAWSNGQRIMATATTGTSTYRRMAELAETDEAIAARHDLYQHRVVEELYDIQQDPNCLVNLIDDPGRQAELSRLRQRLEAWMIQTGDHALEAFRNRDRPEVRDAYVQQKEQEAEQRAQAGRRGNRQAGPQRPRRRADLIALELPDSATAGQTVVAKLRHTLPEALGEQLVHVTLKAGAEDQRVERQVVTVSGSGVLEITFQLPASVPDNRIRFAAFVGQDYPSNLQHLQSESIPVQ
jgi:N-sulfoglucosamine sulfohydrolase